MKGDVRLRTDAPENPTGMIGVGLDGGLELVKTGKLLLSPQALDELDLDDAAVGAAAPVKDVRLEKPAPVGCDRGLDADRGDAVLNGLSESVDADGEDARDGGTGVAARRNRRHVERGEAQRAAERGAVDDAARHAVGTTEHQGGLVEVAYGEGLADARGAHAGLLVIEGRGDVELVGQCAGELFKKLDAARAVAAEAEILADAHPAGVESLEKDVAHERLGRHAGQTRVEWQYVDALDAGSKDGVHLVVERGDARDFAAAAEEVLRMGLEGGDGGNESLV